MLPELLGDEIDLVLPGDGPALAAGLAAALESAAASSPALRDRLADLAWPRVAAQMAAVYRRVIDG